MAELGGRRAEAAEQRAERFERGALRGGQRHDLLLGLCLLTRPLLTA